MKKRDRIRKALSKLTLAEAKIITKGVLAKYKKQANLKAITDRAKKLVSYGPLENNNDMTKEAQRRREARTKARREFADSQPQEGEFNRLSPEQKEQLQIEAGLATSAYVGFGTESQKKYMPKDYDLMEKHKLPKELQSHYNQKTGLLSLPSGLDALILEGPDRPTIAFRGTELNIKDNIAPTDPRIRKDMAAYLVQREGGFSPAYQDAAGILDALLESMPENQSLRVTGHSMGGGLAQFATAANSQKHQGRISASCFNATGLSDTTLGALEGKIEDSQNLISHVRVEGDFASPGSKDEEEEKGVLIGEVMTLPKPDNIDENISVHEARSVTKAIAAQM